VNCKKATDSMYKFVDDDLTPSLRGVFESHIKKCPACKAELEALEDMISCLGSLYSQNAPIDFWHGVKEQLTPHHKPQLAWLTWLMRPVHAAPALAVMLLLAGFLFWPSQVEEPMVQKPTSIPEYSHYIKAHSGLQQQQAFNDPDVAFVTTELETVSLVR